MILLEFYESLVAHPAKLAGHRASVHRQKICKLLAVERDRKAGAVLPLGFLGQVGDQLFSRAPLGDVGELLHECSVLLGYGKEQILHDHGMESAGGGADGHHSSRVEEDHRAVFHGDHVIQQSPALRCEIGLSEHVPYSDATYDGTVAPIIVALNMKLAFHQHRDAVEVLALAKYVFALFIRMESCIQAGQHRTDFLVGDAREQLGSFQYRDVFFHKTPFPL